MNEQEAIFDYNRYKQLLAEAVDETKRLELIEIMIREKAREQAGGPANVRSDGHDGGDSRQGPRIKRASR